MCQLMEILKRIWGCTSHPLMSNAHTCGLEGSKACIGRTCSQALLHSHVALLMRCGDHCVRIRVPSNSASERMSTVAGPPGGARPLRVLVVESPGRISGRERPTGLIRTALATNEHSSTDRDLFNHSHFCFWCLLYPRATFGALDCCHLPAREARTHSSCQCHIANMGKKTRSTPTSPVAAPQVDGCGMHGMMGALGPGQLSVVRC